MAFSNLYRGMVITTAPTHRQVADLLWKEIGRFYRRGSQSPAFVLAGTLLRRVPRAEPR